MGRTEHGVTSFFVSISPDNVASLALAARLGFVRLASRSTTKMAWSTCSSWPALGSRRHRCRRLAAGVATTRARLRSRSRPERWQRRARSPSYLRCHWQLRAKTLLELRGLCVGQPHRCSSGGLRAPSVYRRLLGAAGPACRRKRPTSGAAPRNLDRDVGRRFIQRDGIEVSNRCLFRGWSKHQAYLDRPGARWRLHHTCTEPGETQALRPTPSPGSPPSRLLGRFRPRSRTRTGAERPTLILGPLWHKRTLRNARHHGRPRSGIAI